MNLNNIDTQLVHPTAPRNSHHGASSMPIYQSSTFHQDDPEHLGRYDYARCDNPTREALEAAIAEAEAGVRGFAFASGMAAITAVLTMFSTGDHLVVGEDIYGGTYRALTGVFQRWGLRCTFVDSTDLQQIEAAITAQTRAVLVETPSNPTLRITDLAAVAALAHKHDVLAITDNTFMSPLLQRPLPLGFDIVMHSATKFIGGHSDVIAGLVVVNSRELARRLRQVQCALGAVLGPQDAWLTLRGLKTLAVRMRQQQVTAQYLAHWLQNCAEVRRVYYPGLPTHPGQDIHRRQAAGGGAVIAFDLVSRQTALSLMKRVQLPLVAVSLGGVESILSYPVTMSHAAMPPAEREARGISAALVRLSVGLEAVEDLVADLKQALEAPQKEIL